MFSVFSKLVAPVSDHSILLQIRGRYKFTIEAFKEVYKYCLHKEGWLCLFYPSEDLKITYYKSTKRQLVRTLPTTERVALEILIT